MRRWFKRLWRQRATQRITPRVIASAKFPLADPDASVDEIAAFLKQDEETQLRQYSEFLEAQRDQRRE